MAAEGRAAWKWAASVACSVGEQGRCLQRRFVGLERTGKKAGLEDKGAEDFVQMMQPRVEQAEIQWQVVKSVSDKASGGRGL